MFTVDIFIDTKTKGLNVLSGNSFDVLPPVTKDSAYVKYDQSSAVCSNFIMRIINYSSL